MPSANVRSHANREVKACVERKCTDFHPEGFHPESTPGRMLRCPSCGLVLASTHPFQDNVNNYA